MKQHIYKIIDNKIIEADFNEIFDDIIIELDIDILNKILSAIKLNLSLKKISLSSYFIENEGFIIQLFNILNNKNIKILDFSNTRLNDTKKINSLIKNNNTIENLNLSNNNITDFNLLLDSLKFNKSLKKLDLSYNLPEYLLYVYDFEHDDFPPIYMNITSKFLQFNNNLTLLDLSDNNIINIDILGETLKYNHCLRVLKLSFNRIQDISSLKSLEFNNTLKKLYLDHNKIIDISPLKNNKHLKYLNLGYNQIKDINSFSEMLTFNQNIKQLYLNDNMYKNIDQFISSLETNKSLKFLDLSMNLNYKISIDNCNTIYYESQYKDITNYLLNIDNLCKYLENNQSLKILKLNGCYIKNEINSLNNLIEKNKILKRIYLYNTIQIINIKPKQEYIYDPDDVEKKYINMKTKNMKKLIKKAVNYNIKLNMFYIYIKYLKKYNY